MPSLNADVNINSDFNKSMSLTPHSTLYTLHSTLLRGCRGLSLLALLILLLVGCGDSQFEYTDSRCYVIIDNATHQDPTLAAAMNPAAPGTFCLVSQTISGGASYFTFRSNYGQESKALQNAIDKRRTLVFGYNNAIIVGFGSMDYPPQFYAFDAECPNCFDPMAIPVRSKRLQLSDAGIATCSTCKRQYNMNTGGNIVSGDGGNKMTRYRGATDGPFTVLRVN